MTIARDAAARLLALVLLPACAGCDPGETETPPAAEAPAADGAAPSRAEPAPPGPVPVDQITSENARRELERIERELDDEDG